MAATRRNIVLTGCLFLLLVSFHGVACFDYGAALTKSLLYFEAQRSGKLPPNQRVSWRGDSGLNDGRDQGIDLVGGYYDAGDNMKFGFTMAYTITMLSWSFVEFESQFTAKNESAHALEAIKWGTDYLIKAHPQPNVLYGQVGDGVSDHRCWQRPEDVTTQKNSYKIDDQHPGSDLAGETAAALAAASIAFWKVDRDYSDQLVQHAKQLFEFAKNHQGKYSDSIWDARTFYSSSGFYDELLWAASWLHRATGDVLYLNYIDSCDGSGGVRSEFSWDDKYVGAQILIAKEVLGGTVPNSGKWAGYKSQAEEFICNCIQRGSNNIKRTPGGLLMFHTDWNNLQYTSTATFIGAVYSQYLAEKSSSIQCQGGLVKPEDLLAFAKSQVDYILGANPRSMSYMVGFGPKFPGQVHHRGASIVSIKMDSSPVTCDGGYSWYNKIAPNPNVVDGAIVGGPDNNDWYMDLRTDFHHAEAVLVNTAPLVGVLAKLA
ncbi:cellulase [Ranunculus cassubicifolius]